MSRKISLVWDYFTITIDQSRAKCNECGQTCSRGGPKATSASYSTSNLSDHLSRHHPQIWADIKSKEKQRADATSAASALKPTASSSVQLTLAQSFDQAKVWDINDDRAIKINKLFAEMIALDNEPFEIANHIGLKRLLHGLEPRYKIPTDKYFRTSAVPALYNSLLKQVGVTFLFNVI